MDIWRRIFKFDYQLEIYKPVAKHRRGYFALPTLHGDRPVGKLDAAADRKAGLPASTRFTRTSRPARPPPPPYAKRSGIWLAGWN
jgi:uncharacterized protein YcaQ